MPIAKSILNPRPLEIGKIKIGGLGVPREKRGGGTYRLPERYGHFVITKTERSEEGNFAIDDDLMSKVMHWQKTVAGDSQITNITKIPIMVHSDNIDEEVFPHRLAAYAGKKLYCSGTGEGKGTRYPVENKMVKGLTVLARTGEVIEVDCTCELFSSEAGQSNRKIECKPHGNLYATICAGDSARIGGVHVFRTVGWNSISGILAGLRQIQKVIGTLVQVPLQMEIVTKQVVPEGLDALQTIHSVTVTCTARDIRALSIEALEHASLRSKVSKVYSSVSIAPGDEPDDEQEAICAEFHPQQQALAESTSSDTDGSSPVSGDAEGEADAGDCPPAAEDYPLRKELLVLVTAVANADGCTDHEVKTAIVNKGRADLKIDRHWPALTENDLERLVAYVEVMKSRGGGD